MQGKYETDSFKMKSGGLNQGQMADSNKDTIFGYDRSGYRKVGCKNPYDEDKTETHYVLGWMPGNQDKMDKKAETQSQTQKAAFRFKQLNSDQHGFKVKLGGKSKP